MNEFVGFGFGPIQSGLFLLEAWRSGNFSRYTVAEIDAGLVAAVNGNGGRYHVNIAHADRVEQCEVGLVRMLNPRVAADRRELVEAIRSADEVATALPRVDFYDGDEASAAQVIADAIRLGAKPQVLYAAENHNHAAEILTECVGRHVAQPGHWQAVNTVIGKMSGIITDAGVMQSLGLASIVPGAGRAILVEAFNRILISRITLPGFCRGIEVFDEKPELLPFEEAKLYGHNAVHALLGYLAHERNLRTMADIAAHPDLLALGRRAFVDECGAALCRKYAALGDHLFTIAGFAAYAEDLLTRMTNPRLNDLVERVIRDPRRKLAWSDRIYGTMRLALAQDVTPTIIARGAAAAVRFLCQRQPTEQELRQVLLDIWGKEADASADTLIRMTALQER